jgi:hypothetical protein
MLAGTKRISAANESAAVRCRLPAVRRVISEPQREHFAAIPWGSGGTSWTSPQILQAIAVGLLAGIRSIIFNRHYQMA